MIVTRVTDLALAEKLWLQVEPMLAGAVALSHGCYQTEDVLADILKGDQQLWVAWDAGASKAVAAMTTSIQVYPRRTSVRVNYIGGSRMREWARDLNMKLDEFARSAGADFLEGYGRDWRRMWPGSKRSGVGTIKDLAK